MTPDDTTALLTIIGSGTLVPDGARRSAAHHLLTESASVLMDCGSGAVHGMAEWGVEWRALTHVVFTHFHADHCGDLPALMLAFKHGLRRPRTEPLVLVGPTGLRRLVRSFTEALGNFVLEPGFPVQIVELEQHDEYVDEGGRFRLRCCPAAHTDTSIAYLLSGGWGTLGYTGDTGPSRDVEALMRGCRLLMAECTHADPPETGHHLTPNGVADLAGAVGPEVVVVTHVFPPMSPDEAVERLRETYRGRAVAARDGMRVRITESGVAVDPPRSAV